jgi:hypothetical protein
MSNKAPVEGRCNAKTRDGGHCGNRPIKGRPRCRRHGSGGVESPGGRPIGTGRYSGRFQRESTETQGAIDRLLQDPDLLDFKRPVALQALLVEEVGLLPSEELLRSLAQTKEQRENGEDPRPEQMERARRTYIEGSMRAVAQYHRVLADASKQAKLGDLVAREVLPLFEQVGNRLRVLVDQLVAEGDREEFMQSFRAEVRRIAVRIREIEG